MPVLVNLPGEDWTTGLIRGIMEAMSLQKYDLASFIRNSPTALHAAVQAAACLRDCGFSELAEEDSWSLEPGKGYFVRRGQGGLAAFRTGRGPLAERGANLVLSHTDSPSLKVKILSQEWGHGVIRVGVEVYGSPILSSWFDRELSLAGQVVTLDKGEVSVHTVNFPQPLAVIPHLAIHYNREVNKTGFAPDPQNHLRALVIPSHQGYTSLEALLASQLDVDPSTIIDQDLYFYPTQEGAVLGENYLLSSRIDNLSGCHQTLMALVQAEAGPRSQLAFFFEAEEVGSVTPGGAQSSFLLDVLSRMVLSSGGREEDVYRVKAQSFMVSVDAAHGLHPNFADRHDPKYAPVLGGGPVIKISAGARYATSSPTAARFEGLCREAGVPCQRYIIRSDLASGSTVGPAAAALAGIPAVDVGIPIWAMHSVRETCHLADHRGMISVLTKFFQEE